MMTKYFKSNCKRFLSIILAIAVLAVSLPLTLSIAATDEFDVMDNVIVGDEIKSYDFSKYSSFSELEALGFIYGGAKATPALGSWAYGAASGATVTAQIADGALNFSSKDCDALLLAPAITETNYIYEATFVSTVAGQNAGISNLSWGNAIGDVTSALWMVGRQTSTYISVNGKKSGANVTNNNAGTNNITIDTENEITFKIVCLNGVNYYYYNDQYVFQLAHPYTDSSNTGGRVGFYTYNGNMNIKSMKITAITAAKDIWNGKEVATSLSQDESGNYLISNGAELAFALNGSNNGKTFKLTKDIYLNDVDAINWTTGEVATEGYEIRTWTSGEFNGTINGNGYTIYGLYIKDTTNAAKWAWTNGAGLIGTINGTTTIEKLGIDKAYVYGPSGVAAFIGSLSSTAGRKASFTKCYVGEDVTLTGTTIGGFAGVSQSGVTITQCYSLIKTERLVLHSGATKAAAFTGDTWGADSITESYSIAKAYANTGGRTIQKVYATVQSGNANALTTVIDEANMKGTDVLTNAAKMPDLAECGAFVATESYPILEAFVHEEDDEIWNGKDVATSLNTDEDGNYLISNGAELKFALSGSNNGKTFKLTKDIYLNDVDAINWTTGEVATEGYEIRTWTSGEFNGTINGNGYTIYGLYIKDTTNAAKWAWTNGAGLIGTINGTTTIEKLGIDKAYVYGPSGVAAFIGSLSSTAGRKANFTQCYVGEDVTLTGTTIGGFAGVSQSGVSITQCYSLIKTERLVVHSGEKAAGFLGDTWGTDTITESYSIAKAYANNGNTKTMQKVYATVQSGNTNALTTVIDEANMKGTDVLTNADKMPDLAACGAFVATDSYPILYAFTAEGREEEEEEPVVEEEIGEVWNGSIAAAYAGGTGTEDDPYIISKGSQLALAINSFGCKLDGTAGAYFKLDRDIYLNDVSAANWAATATNSWFEGASNTAYSQYKGYVTDEKKIAITGTFNGNIDGNGHRIYGLFYADGCGSQSSALIPVMSGGSVKNLGIDKVCVTSEVNAAVLAADTVSLTDTIEVDRCYVGADVTVTSTNTGVNKATGGFFGYARGTTETKYIIISNSYALVSPTALTGGNEWKATAFFGETWDTYYKLENVFSIARPINSNGAGARISRFATTKSGTTYTMTDGLADAFKNVYTTTDVSSPAGDYEKYEADDQSTIYPFINIDVALMRGFDALDNMDINGDNAFVAHIGYPYLAVFNEPVLDKATLLEGYEQVTNISAGTNIPTADYYYTATLTASTTVTTPYDTYEITVAEGASVVVDIYHLANLEILYVDGVLVEMNEFDGFIEGTINANGNIQLLLPAFSFDGVSYGVQLQLADLLGNTVVGSNGFKLNATLEKPKKIEDLESMHSVEYGFVFNINSELVDDNTNTIVSELTGEDLSGEKFFFDENGNVTLELTGLSIEDKELFYISRGFATVTIADGIEYTYYAAEADVMSPIYAANDAYNAEETAKTALTAIYGESDKFITKLTNEIDFTLFADYHYKEGMYTSQLSDLKTIVNSAEANNSDFILSLGDMTNDMGGSKEVTNYLLNGTYSSVDGTETNSHSFAFYNIYGNHELETTGNTLSYVNTTLTNSDVHWGDGSVGSVAAINSTGTTEAELATGSYYWFENNGIRIICVNNNFSYNPTLGVWEHNKEGSNGRPKGNTKGNSLGPVQTEWLEVTLMDAAEKGTPCIIAGHDSYADGIGATSDMMEVRALFAKANNIRKGTVIAALNGHNHTDRQAVIEDVLYLDVNTVRNNRWINGAAAHYTDAHTISLDHYDENGNYTSSETVSLSTLSQGNNTWFAADPLYCTVKITQTGTVTVEGIETGWMYDVEPPTLAEGIRTSTTSGTWSVGDAAFTIQ